MFPSIFTSFTLPDSAYCYPHSYELRASFTHSWRVPSIRSLCVMRFHVPPRHCHLVFPFLDLVSGPCFWSDSLPVHTSCVLTPETSPHSSIGSVHALSLALGSSIRFAASSACAFAFRPSVDHQFLQISPQLRHSTRDYPAAFLLPTYMPHRLSFHAPALSPRYYPAAFHAFFPRRSLAIHVPRLRLRSASRAYYACSS